jgi:hypothetical protein
MVGQRPNSLSAPAQQTVSANKPQPLSPFCTMSPTVYLVSGANRGIGRPFFIALTIRADN